MCNTYIVKYLRIFRFRLINIIILSFNLCYLKSMKAPTKNVKHRKKKKINALSAEQLKMYKATLVTFKSQVKLLT